MLYDHHAPPHFHASIGGEEAWIVIRTLEVLYGSLPPAKLRHVLAWAREHQGELALNWINCHDDEPPDRI